MCTRPVFPFVAGLVLSVLTGAPARAANYYVSPTGSGSACSLAQPCREIRDALNLVSPNDTILVADGNYLFFVIDDIDGLPGQPISILAQGTGAIVTPSADPNDRDTIFVTFSDWIVIDGLRSFGANRAAVRIDESHHVTVRNGVFGDNTRWGIFTDFSDDLLLETNECYGSQLEHGIYVSNSGDRPVVRGNRLHDNAGAGVQLNADLSSGGDGIISDALIEANVVYGNGSAGGAGINLDGVQDSVVRNNLLYDNHATGIVNYMGDGAEGPTGMQIYHNTVVQAQDGRWALLFGGTAGPNTVRNNILYHPDPNKGGLLYLDPSDVPNVDSDYNVVDRITPDDEGTLYTLAEWQQAFNREPSSRVAGPLAALFVDAAGNDYHLPLGSPALDNGLTLASVPVDIEGTPRPQGPTSDVGAYERPGAAVVPTAFFLGSGTLGALEGDTGSLSYAFAVGLSAPTTATVTVDYATADGTATQPGDYVPTAGTLSFAPGATSAGGIVTVNGDTITEPDEVYFVNLSNPVNATLGTPSTETVLILNDDAPLGLTREELTHGGMQWADLGALPGPSPDVDFYRIFQDAYASYQVVVDGASGDLSAPGSPLALERVAADGTTVLQSAMDAGGSGSRSLSWQRVMGIPEPNELIRVRSGGCTTTCDAADVYRIRSWETTGFVPRFNNSATQVTVLVIHNDGATPVDGRVWYRDASGAPFADEFFFGLAPLATLVFNTSQAAPGASGSITVAHSGSYGQLTGKAVAVEPATGFTFDTELVSRLR